MQSERELNPYWKSGGTGMPEDNKVSEARKNVSIGDNGLTWWTKALERCHELAREQGKSVEEVAAERYGSLESLNMKISEARKTSGRFMKPGSGRSTDDRHQHSNRQSNWRKSDSKSKKERSPSPEIKNKNTKRERSPSLEVVKPPPVDNSLNNLDINELGAKLIKAELMGDEVCFSNSKVLVLEF